jgi:hypothetical protein
VLSRFLEVKKDKYPQSEIDSAYDSLVNANLIEA